MPSRQPPPPGRPSPLSPRRPPPPADAADAADPVDAVDPASPGDDPADPVVAAGGDPDAGLRERVVDRWDRAVRRARWRAPTPADMVEESVAAEVALACGLSQSRAGD